MTRSVGYQRNHLLYLVSLIWYKPVVKWESCAGVYEITGLDQVSHACWFGFDGVATDNIDLREFQVCGNVTGNCENLSLGSKGV